LKKLTYEFVKEQFALEGYELLEDTYVNSKTKLRYRCSEDHEHNISWSHWNKGDRCPHCSGRAKRTVEFVKEQFGLEGYELLEDHYVNNATKMKYRCSKGHEHSMCWGDWQQGKRCIYCAGLAKHTIEFVRTEFEKENYILFSKGYTNAHTKLDYVCIEGHRGSMSWSNWYSGKRCPICRDLGMFGSGNPSWKGGISIEPYCNVWKDKQFKTDIKKRDNFTCQNSDCRGISERLAVHHIDYNKKNCHPDNLITVCASCNARANFNREQHTEFYKSIMDRRNYGQRIESRSN